MTRSTTLTNIANDALALYTHTITLRGSPQQHALWLTTSGSPLQQPVVPLSNTLCGSPLQQPVVPLSNTLCGSPLQQPVVPLSNTLCDSPPPPVVHCFSLHQWLTASCTHGSIRYPSPPSPQLYSLSFTLSDSPPPVFSVQCFTLSMIDTLHSLTSLTPALFPLVSRCPTPLH